MTQLLRDRRARLATCGAMMFVATLTVDSSVRAQNAAPADGDIQKGTIAFIRAGCHTCHGTVGQGGAGARLAPNPLSAAALIAYVRSGRRGWSVAGGMPAYPTSVITDETLRDIRAYLASIPAPPPAASMPLLRD
jgi:mono/diheme cytochrome c family protein